MATLPATSRRSYIGVLVTLTSANTNYNLLALVNAVLAPRSESPGMVRELNFEAYQGIDGSAGNTNDILVGDAELSTTRFAYILRVGDARLYRSTLNNADLGSIYVRSAGAAQKLSLEIITG